jgi:hypothetical protein
MNNPPFATANNPAVFNRPQLKPDHFFVADLYRGPRENHAQKKYVPIAMALSLATESRWQSPMARARRVAEDRSPSPPSGERVGVRGQALAPNTFIIQNSSLGRKHLRSPGSVRLNRSNVKRKPGARGRTR